MKGHLGKNTIAGLLGQIITIICGFVLPRCMLNAYGSTVNGVVSSVSQFLGVISFMQLGVGAVVQSAFYNPLAKKDIVKINEIYNSSSKFFRTIAMIFLAYVIVLFGIYPTIVNSQFDFWFSGSLIIIMAISLFSQYYFGLTNQLLLMADQKAYIPLTIDAATVILNTIVSVWFIRLGAGIQIVRLLSTSIFVLRPIILSIYVKKYYSIDKNVKYVEEPIKQKWNGFAQHLAAAVMDNTDVIILTLCSTLENVSIYYVYNMIVFGVRQLIVSTAVGVQSFFGRVLIDFSIDEIRRVFEKTETIFHFCITVFFSCVTILIVPFVKVYTKGIDDVNYIVPLFAIILTLSQAVYCYRVIYYIIIKAAGHYKETQYSAIIEMILNLSISIVCVVKFGLVGVAVGTFVATSYRLLYFINYLTHCILNLRYKRTVSLFIMDIVSLLLSYLLTKSFNMSSSTYYSWFVKALKVGIVSLGVSVMIYTFGNIDHLVLLIKENRKR